MRSEFQALGVCLLVYLWMEHNPDVLLDGFAILEVYIYINLITVILFPEGLYESTLYTDNWFLGYKNPQIRTILPIVSVSMIRSYRKFGKISLQTKFLLLCSVLTFLLIDSATALVGMAIFMFLFLLFHSKERSPSFFTLINCVGATVVAFLAIVVFRFQKYFSFLIEEILKRNMTFTTRTTIWDRTFNLVRDRLFIGYGYLTGDDYVGLLGNAHYTHPHNYFLYVAMSGGIILLIVLFWGYLMANKELKATSYTVYSKIILCCLASFLVMGLTEAITGTVLFYPMLILAMESDKLAELGYQNIRTALKLFNKRIIFTFGK